MVHLADVYTIGLHDKRVLFYISNHIDISTAQFSLPGGMYTVNPTSVAIMFRNFVCAMMMLMDTLMVNRGLTFDRYMLLLMVVVRCSVFFLIYLNTDKKGERILNRVFSVPSKTYIK